MSNNLWWIVVEDWGWLWIVDGPQVFWKICCSRWSYSLQSLCHTARPYSSSALQIGFEYSSWAVVKLSAWKSPEGYSWASQNVSKYLEVNPKAANSESVCIQRCVGLLSSTLVVCSVACSIHLFLSRISNWEDWDALELSGPFQDIRSFDSWDLSKLQAVHALKSRKT